MTIIQEIHTWSKGLAAWQQDAVARLYSSRTLSTSDMDDLYALAKAEVGIADANVRTPKKLQDADVALPPNPTRLVKLVGIKDLANVNALANGGRLPIAPSGITVIYGENGAGKSGYSRIFKHACRARDRSERILPNARIDPAKTGVAQAVFEALVDGEEVDLPWTYLTDSPEPLSDIAIFDTHCARAYIDNQGDFAYVPYGLDILEGLVSVCGNLKAKATAEKTANAPSDAAYATLAKEQTDVAKLLAGIPKSTKASDVETLATMSDAEGERLTLLTKILGEADAKQKAQTIRHKATRVTGLVERMGLAAAVVSDDKLAELRTLVERSNAAKKAAEIAATDFKQTPGQLPGTGGEEWKVLFQAAREFATISHAGHEFPGLPEESACPLCQNPLGQSGIRRLAVFEAFVKHAAERAAKDARTNAIAAFRLVEQARLDLHLDDALSQELAEIRPELATACAAMQTALEARQAAILLAAGGKTE